MIAMLPRQLQEYNAWNLKSVRNPGPACAPNGLLHIESVIQTVRSLYNSKKMRYSNTWFVKYQENKPWEFLPSQNIASTVLNMCIEGTVISNSHMKLEQVIP